MKKNIIIMVLSIALLVSLLFNIFMNTNMIKVNKGSISDYQTMLDGYIPSDGYVKDGKTAVKIAIAILDDMYEVKGGFYSVKYDKNEKVWIVQNDFFLRSSSYVFIDQSNGKILSAWKDK